jgi:hypothetical protein
MIIAVEASSRNCQPPSVKLQIYFDLELGPPFPEEKQCQKNEQQ